MERKYVVFSAVCAVAVLLPLGRWALSSWQDAADRKAARMIESQFASRRAASGINSQTASIGSFTQRGPGASGRWGGRQSGQPGQPGQWGARRNEAMAQEVGLTPTQAKQVQAVQQSARPLMFDIFRNPQLTREQKRAQTQQIRAAQQAQISKLLTPDQQVKFAAFQQKMREQWQQWQARRQANGGGGQGSNNHGTWGGS